MSEKDNTPKPNGPLILLQEFHEAIPVVVEIKCPECKMGNLKAKEVVGQNQNGMPQILHECDNCGAKQVLGQQFPQVIHEKGKKIGGKEEFDDFISEKQGKKKSNLITNLSK